MEMLYAIFEKLGSPNPLNCEYYANFSHKLQILPKVEKGNLEEEIPTLCAEGLNLLKRMLSLNPKKRIAAFEALEHPFFSLNFNDQTSEKCHTQP